MIFASAATVDSEGWLWIGWFSPAAMEIPENQREPTNVCNHDWFSGTRTYLTWQQMICNWKLHHGHVHLKVLDDIRPPSRLTWMPRVSICSRQRRGCPSLKTGDVVLTINENISFQLRWCDPNLGLNVRRNPPPTGSPGASEGIWTSGSVPARSQGVEMAKRTTSLWGMVLIETLLFSVQNDLRK